MVGWLVGVATDRNARYLLTCPNVMWEARPRPKCQGPQRSVTGDLPTTNLEDEVDGQKEGQGDQRDGDKEKEVNGDVESIRETHNEMTHGTCTGQCDECGP